jgi:predicted amidohydrolase
MTLETVTTVAAAQTIPVPADVEANLDQHVRLARLAAKEGAHVLVFPELSLTGYELSLADDLAFTEDDPRLAPLPEMARSTSMVLVVGAPVRLDSGLHIGAFVLSPDGTTQVYTKHHLGAFPDGAAVDGIVPSPETTYFQPGDRNPFVMIAGRPAAVAVCADVGRKSHSRVAAKRGARAYLASMFVIPSEIAEEEARLGAIAGRRRMAVVFANFGGPSGGLASAGNSAIWSPAGEVVARCPGAGAAIAIARDEAGTWSGKVAEA